MAYLEEQEWMILNEIGYNVSSTYNMYEIYNNIFGWLGLLIDYDCGILSIIEKDENDDIHNLKVVSHKNINDSFARIYEMETVRSNTTKLVIYSAKKTAYVISDLIDYDKMFETGIYQRFYKPQQLMFSMGMCIVFGDEPLAIIQLFRKKGRNDFSDRDLFVLTQLQKHMAYRMCYENRKGDVKYFYAESYQEKLYKKYGITEKEKEIFEYAIANLSNEEIAEKMNISVHTVKKHFHSIYTKMGVSNRIQFLQNISDKHPTEERNS